VLAIVRDALRVVHGAIRGDDVVVRAAVLGDEHALRGIVAVQAHQELRERQRVDLPAHGGVLARGALRGHVQPGARLVRHDRARVIVDAQKVDRATDDVQIRRRHLGRLRAEEAQHVLRVGPLVEGIHEPAVGLPVVPGGRGDVLRAIGGRVRWAEVQRDADLGRGAGAAQHRHSQAVRQEHVVRHAQREAEILPARSVRPQQVAQEGDHPGLVVRDPVPDAIAEAPRHYVHIVGEALGGIPRSPAPDVLQRLWQIPVVQGRIRSDAVGEQFVHQGIVEIEPPSVHRPTALGQHAGPTDREAIGAHAQFGHEGHVLAVQVVVVVGHVAVLAADDLARPAAERVPDAVAAFLAATLDLERTGGGAPHEAIRKAIRDHARSLLAPKPVCGECRGAGRCCQSSRAPCRRGF